MRTSAAPTIFPVYNGYVDGGICANNPSVLAVSKVMAHYPEINSRNVVVLSLGKICIITLRLRSHANDDHAV
jgi:patatin-like phospholipase/acyl hydrolase